MKAKKFIRLQNVIVRLDAINCIRVDMEKKGQIEIRMHNDIQSWDCGSEENAFKWLKKFEEELC